MNCKKCNNTLKIEDVFCPICGERVDTITNLEDTVGNNILKPDELDSSELEPIPMESIIQNKKIKINEPVVGINDTPISSLSTPIEKNNKKPIIRFLIVIILLAVLIIGFLFYKFLFPNNSNETPTVKTNNEKTVINNYTIIGNENVGYLKLPGEWDKFQDIDGKKSIQYTKDIVWIVTLDSYIPSTSYQSAESMSQASLYNIQNNESNISDVKNTIVKLGKYDAYQNSCLYSSDNTWLVEWFFETEDNIIHYISIEGPDNSSDYFKIPDTFSLTKIK